MMKKPGVILIFDIDGTLTYPRKKITNDIKSLISKLSNNYYIATLGSSDFIKQREQLGDAIDIFDYCFAENGTIGYKKGNLETPFTHNSLKQELGNDTLNKIINYCLKYISELDIPIKRGTFIEFRNSMMNISPIGRNCSQQERDDFEVYNKEHKVLETFVDNLLTEFKDLEIEACVGGQISFDLFPKGWDKTYALRHLKDFKEIHFFGNKTYKGGNDHTMFIHNETIGHTVNHPEELITLINEKFIVN